MPEAGAKRSYAGFPLDPPFGFRYYPQETAKSLAYNLGNSPASVNRIRVAKIGDTNGGATGNASLIDKMDLEILYTSDSGPLESRQYKRVANLKNGYFGNERITADAVHSDGRIDNDQHDFIRDGYFSLTFDAVSATAVAIRFGRDDGGSGVHYGTYEFQVMTGPEPLPAPGANYAGNVMNLDINASSGGSYTGPNAAGHAAPFWNSHHSRDGVKATGLKDALGNDTPINVEFINVSDSHKTSWTNQNLLEDFFFSSTEKGEAKTIITGLDASSLYNLSIYTGVEGGIYRIGDSQRAALYGGTGPNGDSAYFDISPMRFAQGRNYVFFSTVSPDSDGNIIVHWKNNPASGQDHGNFSGLTLEQITPLGHPVHFDVTSSNGSVYQGPSVLNDGSPVWNSSTSDDVRSLFDAAGSITSVGARFAGAQGRFTTHWSTHPLLHDFLFKDHSSFAVATITGLNPRQNFDLYIYAGVEGGEYWINNTVKRAKFNAAGPGNDIHYAPDAPWSEGMNYVVFKSVTPSSNGELLIHYRHNPESPGDNGDFSGFTVVPAGRSSGNGSGLRQVVNLDFQPPHGKLYDGPNVIQQPYPVWNMAGAPPNSIIDISNLRNSLGLGSGIRVTAENANAAEITSWTDQSLIGDYYFRDRHGIARVRLHGLKTTSQYNIYIHPGPEGGQFTIGDQTQVAAFDGTGPGGDDAYRPGASANFVNGKTSLLFPGVTPDSSGTVLISYTDSPQNSGAFALLAGLTLDELVPLDNAIHVDIESTNPAEAAPWNGESALLDKPHWNHISRDYTMGLMDSGGNNTSAGLKLAGANFRQVSTWSNHPLLKDALVRGAGNPARAEISGLNPTQFFDLYVYTGTGGGTFRVNGSNLSAAYLGTGPNGDPDYRGGAPWKAGKNYILFRRVRSDARGIIQMEYLPNPATPGVAATFAGLSLVPAGVRPDIDPVIATQVGRGGGLGGASPSGLALTLQNPGKIVLQTFNSATMSVEQFVTGAFEAGKYQTIKIVDESLNALGIAALTLHNVILEVKGTCAIFREGSFNIMGFKGRLSNIECDRYSLYPFKSRMFVKVPLLGEIDADFWMGLAVPAVVVVGGEFSVPGVHGVGPLSFSDLRVAIDPRNNRFGAQGAAGFKGKFVNLVRDIPCPLTVSTSKRFGGGLFFQGGSLEEARLIGNNLQKQLGPNRIFLNRVDLSLQRDPAMATMPIGDDNWLFKGVTTIGVGCPLEIKGKPLFPITVDGTLLFGSSGDIDLSGDGKILGEPLLGAKLATNWKNGGKAELGANFSLFKIVSGSVDVGINPSGYFGSANVEIVIPEGVPLVASQKFKNQEASFRGDSLRGTISIPYNRPDIKCVGPYTKTLPRVPYVCGKWYAPKVCFWTPRVTVPRVCYPTVTRSSLNINYVVSSSTFDFKVTKTNQERTIGARSMLAPTAVNDEGTSLQFFSNFKAVDRYNSQAGALRRSAKTSSHQPVVLTIPEESPGAVFTLFHDKEPVGGIDFVLHFPDGSTSVRLSDGPLPNGFDSVAGFSSVQTNPDSASIFLENPPIGEYRIEIENRESIGEFSAEVIVMEPEFEIEILDIQPGAENGVFDLTYRGVDKKDEAAVEILIASSRDGIDVEFVDVFDASHGEHTVSIDVRDLNLNPGRYYLGASIASEEREGELAISESSYPIFHPDAPGAITGIETNAGDRSISVTWEQSDDPRVVEYLILYSDGEVQSLHDLPNVVVVDAVDDHVTLSDMDNGRPYLITVVAVTEEGIESIPSHYVRAIPSPGIGLNPPSIISIPEDLAGAGTPYLYVPLIYDADTGVATEFVEPDPDNNEIDQSPYTWSLLEAPDGMTITSFGAIQWTPTEEQIGEHRVVLQVEETPPSDTLGFEGLPEFIVNQEYSIEVVPDETPGVLKEHPYQFMTSPRLSAVEKREYRYSPFLWGPEDASLTIAVREGPAGLTIEGQSIVWTPQPGAVGAQTRIEVLTSTGDVLEQNWYLDVVPEREQTGMQTGEFGFAGMAFEAFDDSDINVQINRSGGAFGHASLTLSILDTNGNTAAIVPVRFGNGQASRQINLREAILSVEDSIDFESISLVLAPTSGGQEPAVISEDAATTTLTIQNVGSGRVVAIAPKLFYPGNPMEVGLIVLPDDNVESYEVVEFLPAGWIVLDVSGDAEFLPEENAIVWGSFEDSEVRYLSYQVLPPDGADDLVEFSGLGIFDSFEFPTSGTRASVNRARYQLYSSEDHIEVSPFGPGSPYPSIIEVDDSQALKTGAPIVGVNDILHPYFNDLNIVLEGPDRSSTPVILAGNIELEGNDQPVSLVYFDRGETPYRFGDVIQSGVVKPLNEDPDFNLALPAPQGPYLESLQSLGESDPAGEWKLYIMDSLDEDGGSLSGWDLYLPIQGLHISEISDHLVLPGDPVETHFLVYLDGVRIGEEDLELEAVSSDPNVLPVVAGDDSLTFEDGVFTFQSVTSKSHSGVSTVTISARIGEREMSQSFTVVSDTPVILSGMVGSGYLSEALVYIDSNHNGMPDEGEAGGITLDDGSFSLEIQLASLDKNKNGRIDAHEALIRAEDGYSTITGAENLQSFASFVPDQARSDIIINPLTSIAANLSLADPGLTRSEAQAKVKSAFGLDASLDLYSYDPIATAREGDLFSAQVLAQSQQVSHTQALVGGFILPEDLYDRREIGNLVIEFLALQIADGLPIDLTSPELLDRLILTFAGDDDSDEAARHWEALKLTLLELNTRVDRIAGGQVSSQSAVEQLSVFEVAAHGLLLKAVQRLAAGAWTPDFVEYHYTGKMLSKLLDLLPHGDVFGDETRRGSAGFPFVTAGFGEDGLSTAPIMIVRRDGNRGEATFKIEFKGDSASAGDDFLPDPMLVTLDDRQVWKEIDLSERVLNDSVTEPSEILTITLIGQSDLATVFTGGDSLEITILDDDAPGHLNWDADQYTLFEGGRGSDMIRVIRSGGLAGVIDFDISLSSQSGEDAGLDFESLRQSSRFEPGESVKTIRITPKDDGFYEVDEQYLLSLGIAEEGGDPAVHASLILKSDDDNTPPVINSIPDLFVGGSTRTVRIPFTAADAESGSEGLRYAASVSNPFILAPQSLQFDSAGDSPALLMEIFPEAFGSSLVTIEASDGRDATQATFEISVMLDGGFQILPDLSNQVMNQGGELVLPLALNDPDPSPGDFLVEVSSSDSGLVPPGGLALSGDGLQGQLVISPHPEKSGEVEITLTATSGLRLLDSAVFTLTVLPNDSGPELTVVKSNGAIILDWEGEAVLQGAGSPTGPWQNIGSLTGPYTVETSEADAGFFRLLQNAEQGE